MMRQSGIAGDQLSDLELREIFFEIFSHVDLKSTIDSDG